MTVKECYSQMGGDYNNVLSRFYDEAMIKRLLGRFIDDTSFRALEQAMAEGDVQSAFNAAHTLRGVECRPSLPSVTIPARSIFHVTGV